MNSANKQGNYSCKWPILAGFWPLKYFCGVFSTDSSGNGYNGTLQGNPECENGVVGYALKLDGMDDKFTVESLVSRELRDFSISLWFKTNRNTRQTLIQSWDGNRAYQLGYAVGINVNIVGDLETKIRAETKVPDATCSTSVINSVEVNQWYHIVLVRNSSEQKGYLYINGKQVASCTDPSFNLSLIPSYPLTVGYGFDKNALYEAYFDGLIDEIRIYDKALTEQEIKTY